MSTSVLSTDELWMHRALALAREGSAFASPNPAVGCVIVSNGIAAGQGFHNYALRDHAEIVALRHAGGRARGATAYVTLEPCSHHGRTGPCADALVAAGVMRVVIATRDPNPEVSGSGIARLRAAGIAVTEDVLCAEARALILAFTRYITTGLPFVTLKTAVSAEGNIAPPPGSLPRGKRAQLTSAQANGRVQELRAGVDALVTGIGTVLADDPLLTDRSGLARRRPLLRVVLDSRLRIPLHSRIVRSAKDDLLVLHCNGPEEKEEQLHDAGVFAERIMGRDGHVHLPEALARLSGGHGVTSVLLEAGTHLNTAMLQANLVDAVAILATPVQLGDKGVPFAFPPFSRIVIAALAEEGAEHLGPDRLYHVPLRDPWPYVDLEPR